MRRSLAGRSCVNLLAWTVGARRGLPADLDGPDLAQAADRAVPHPAELPAATRSPSSTTPSCCSRRRFLTYFAQFGRSSRSRTTLVVIVVGDARRLQPGALHLSRARAAGAAGAVHLSAAVGRADHAALPADGARSASPTRCSAWSSPTRPSRCPIALWLLRSFMAGIPEDLEAAALVDGASRMGAFVDVILPQALPGIISTALFTFILAWNEYLYALVLVNTRRGAPLTTGRDEHADHLLQHRMVAADGGLGDDEPAADRHLRLPAELPDARLRRRRREGLSAWPRSSFEQVRKAFGQVVAIEELDLAIRSGEFVSLLGPSGCGKTTTLRMLAGLEQPTSGTISIGDRVVNDVPPGKRDIAMVFQSYALYPHMTVAREHRLSAEEARRRRAPSGRAAGAAHAAELLQLEALLDAQAAAALGRPAAARRARPRAGARTGRLPARRAAVESRRQAARAYARRADRAAPAHRQDDGLRHARPARSDDDVGSHRRDGRRACCSSSTRRGEIYHRPANAFVAGFIGTPSMNFLRGRMQPDGAHLRFEAERLSLTLPRQLVRPDALRDGVAVTLGVRPEDVALSGDGEPALVRVVEPTGHESIVFFDLGGHSVVGRVGPDVAARARPGGAPHAERRPAARLRRRRRPPHQLRSRTTRRLGGLGSFSVG